MKQWILDSREQGYGCWTKESNVVGTLERLRNRVWTQRADGLWLSRQIYGNLRTPAVSHGAHRQEKDLRSCSERDSFVPQTKTKRWHMWKNVSKAGERATQNIRDNYFLCSEFEGNIRDEQN